MLDDHRFRNENSDREIRHRSITKPLLELYRDLRGGAALIPAPLVQRLGCPCLPFPRPRWSESSERLLVVGQEPYKWEFKTGMGFPWSYPPMSTLSDFLACAVSVEALTYGYVEDWYLWDDRWGSTPFTRTCKFLIEHLRKGPGPADVLNANLFLSTLSGEHDDRSPVKNATPDEMRQIRHWQRGFLTETVDALKPTAVIFFSGPDYDKILLDEFAGAGFEAVAEHTIGEFAQVVHDSLPKKSFRTYHPGFLNRTGRLPVWSNELAELISGA